MTSARKVVTFGEVMLRLAAPGLERLLQTPRLEATFGGSEANVAISLSMFGMHAAHVTVLPENNPLSDACIGELRRFDVDTSGIVRAAGRFGVYYLEAGANQRPPRILYDRENSAIAQASPATIPWEQIFQPGPRQKPCTLMCTMVCSGPLDCGAGSCGCVNGRCSVVPGPSAVAWNRPARSSGIASGARKSTAMPR